jgi:DNA-binding response OmpR family regulator
VLAAAVGAPSQRPIAVPKERSQVARLMKLLVVEDNVTMAAALRYMLRHIGFSQVYESNDGNEALRMLQHQRFDLVIVDWLLPSLSGVALVKWMRTREAYAETPVIMVTTKDQAEDVLIAVESGVTEYVLKPLDKEILTRKIMKVLAKQKMAIS